MLYIVVLLAYLLIVVAIGYASRRKSKSTTKDTFVAGGTLGFGMLLPMVLGEAVAGAGTTGTATGGFTSGLVGIHAQLGLALGCVFVAICLCSFFAAAGRAGAMSGPEAFAKRFGKKVHAAVMVITLIVMTIMCAVQPKALASLLAPIVGLSVEAMTALIGLLFLGMALAGIKGIAKMNVVNSVVLFVGLLIVMAMCLARAGGIGPVFQALPPDYLDFTGTGFMTMLASITGSMLGVGVSAAPINACYCAKTRKASRAALLCAGLIAAAFAFCALLIGMAGYVVMPDAEAASILFVFPESISPALSMVTVLAVAAAVFSTGPFFLLYISTVVVRDFVVPYTSIDDDAKQLNLSRGVMVACCLISIFLANNYGSILSQIMGAMQIQAVETIVLLIGLKWKRLTNRAAFWAILVGGVGAAVYYFAGQPLGVSTLWIGVALLLIPLVAFSVANGQAESQDWKSYRSWRDVADVQIVAAEESAARKRR